MTVTHDLSPETFWAFSTKLYSDPALAARCLRLQDNAGVNVNMLLFLCWCLQHQRIVVLKQWHTLKAAIAHSDQELQQHRQRRSAAKEPESPEHADYEQLKHTELELEAQQQSVLVSAFNNMNVDSTDMAGINASVVAFIHAYTLRDNPEAIADIRHIIKDIV
ncbi:TIGR02444 family protein [Salinimonas chungwhensis]|uniref:TIGR02444 family protein n=1 Tax=Salinimonas chungwhensis TaxID=265425 RepID=UPI000361FEE5|nr:TIGR02444 family protein [Salinimonas chungwhensis]